ncbi:unnamed protein product [Symbiodinium natans]|uniref:Uncharacterized protein n=1 Tax=Symbiodinium natans TaxID=878477 RepID=A0A812QDU7_9DINO|nr:unnamed protein product [Symbiodinium natans]
MAGAQKVRRPISLLEPSPRLPSKDAGRLLHAMRAGKVEANLFHYNALLSCLEKDLPGCNRVELWCWAALTLGDQVELAHMGFSQVPSSSDQENLWRKALGLLAALPSLEVTGETWVLRLIPMWSRTTPPCNA